MNNFPLWWSKLISKILITETTKNLKITIRPQWRQVLRALTNYTPSSSSPKITKLNEWMVMRCVLCFHQENNNTMIVGFLKDYGLWRTWSLVFIFLGTTTQTGLVHSFIHFSMTTTIIIIISHTFQSICFYLVVGIYTE